MVELPYLDILHQYICASDLPPGISHWDSVESHQTILEILHVEMFSFLVINLARDGLQPCAGVELPSAYLNVCYQQIQSNAYDDILQFAGEEVVWQEATSEVSTGFAAEARSLQAAVYMRLPVRVQTQLIGVLVFASTKIQSWEDMHLEAARLLVNYVETILENTILSIRNQSLDTLVHSSHKMGQLINDSLQLSESLDQIVEEAAQLIHASGAEILLAQPQKSFRIVARAGIPHMETPLVEIPYGKGLSGQVAIHKRSILVESYADYEYALRDTLPFTRIVSVIGVPLISRDKLLGVVIVYRLVDDPLPDFARQLIELLARELHALETAGSNPAPAPFHDGL